MGDTSGHHLTSTEVGRPEYTVEAIELPQVTRAPSSPARQRKRIERSFFRKFQQKLCDTYVEDKYSDQENICVCGRSQLDHAGIARFPEEGEVAIWQSDKHTNLEKTEAYGEIIFEGRGYETRAKFIRLADNTDYDLIWELLVDQWKLKLPSILISIVGSAGNFEVPKKDIDWFTKGLWEMSTRKSAWIFTGGTNSGIFKYSSRAMEGNKQLGQKSTKSYCIGVTPWGVVDQRDKLMSTHDEAITYFVKSGIAGEKCLDNRHSHFLLVDDGTDNTWWTDIQMRIKILQEMKTRVERKQNLESNISLPVVCVVIGGGGHTIKMVKEYLCHSPPVPVVILEDSGKAPIAIEFATRLSVEVTDIDDEDSLDVQRQLLELVKTTFDYKDEFEQKEIFENLVICSAKKDSIIFCNPDTAGMELDQLIIESLIDYHTNNPTQQLYVAVAWNGHQVAREKILNHKHTYSDALLEMILTHCLATDKPDFVRLLLSDGVSITKYLTRSRLLQLYQSRIHSDTCNIKQLYAGRWRKAVLQAVGDAKGKLLIELEIFNPDSQLTPKTLKDGDKIVDDAYDHLFLWAILTNMSRMSKKLWIYGPNPLARAVVGYHLLSIQLVAAEASEYNAQPSSVIAETKQLFEETSVALLNDCYMSDEKLASQLLTIEMGSWARPTCISLAAFAGHQSFLGHISCQSLLSSVWYGGLKFFGMHSLKLLVNASKVKFVITEDLLFVMSSLWQHVVWKGFWDLFSVVLGILFPFLIPFYTFKTKEEMELLPTARKETYVGSRAEDKQTENQGRATSVNAGTNGERRTSSDSSGSVDDEGTRVKLSLVSALEAQHGNKLVKRTVNAVISPTRTFYEFYIAPITIFWIHLFFYIGFLMLFGYVSLVKLPKDASVEEWILFVWVTTLLTDEIRQIFDSEAIGIWKKFAEWKGQLWNMLDVLAIILFYIAFGLRFHQDTMIAANILYSLDCLIWIIRLMERFRVNKYLGPYVIMIARMILDLMYFSIVLGIFLVAYAVVKNAVLEPYTEPSWTLIDRVFYLPYLETFGNVNLEQKAEANKTVLGTKKYYDGVGILGVIVVDLYLLAANLLLLNLLIAVFNNTYSEIQGNSISLWRYQRYSIIMDYAKRPWLPAPFNILAHIWRLLSGTCRVCCLGESFGKNLRILTIPNMEAKDKYRLANFERGAIVKFLRGRRSENEKEDEVLEGIDSLRESLFDEITKVQEEQQVSKSAFKGFESQINSVSEKQTNILQRLRSRSGSEEEYPIMARRSTSPAEERGQPEVPTRSVSSSGDEGSNVVYPHVLALSSPYAGSVRRQALEAADIPWDSTSGLLYAPEYYTAPIVLASLSWADPEIKDAEVPLQFNKIDGEIDRTSYGGDYKVVDGYPLNPRGRTGLTGRGLLGRWGPNFGMKFVFTRWLTDVNSQKSIIDGHYILEVLITVKERFGGVKHLCLPVESERKVEASRFSRVMDDAFDMRHIQKLPVTRAEKKRLRQCLEKLMFITAENVLSSGYEDDSRNTDNAWVETSCFWFHDDKNEVFKYLYREEMKSRKNRLVWMKLDDSLTLSREDSKVLALVKERVSTAVPQ